VGLPATGLTVAEDCRRKPVNSHIYQPKITKSPSIPISINIKQQRVRLFPYLST
jgi:hypothetical protein